MRAVVLIAVACIILVLTVVLSVGFTYGGWQHQITKPNISSAKPLTGCEQECVDRFSVSNTSKRQCLARCPPFGPFFQ